MDSELIGVLFVLVCAVTNAILPVFAKFSSASYPPIFFAAISMLLGSLSLFAVIMCRKKLRDELFSLKFGELPQHLANGFLGSGIANILFFVGIAAAGSSSINASIFLQSEMIFSLFISYYFLRERITKQQVAYTLLVFIGILAVLFKGSALSLSVPELMILAVPLFWQLGHVFGKRLLKTCSPWVVLFMRMLTGSIVLMAASVAFEGNSIQRVAIGNAFLLSALFQGAIVFAAGTIAWYYALTHINLSKASAIIGAAPVLSFLLAWWFLGETPSAFQLVGLLLVLLGLSLVSLKIKSGIRPQ